MRARIERGDRAHRRRTAWAPCDRALSDRHRSDRQRTSRRCMCSSRSTPLPTRSRTARSASRSPIRRTSTGSTPLRLASRHLDRARGGERRDRHRARPARANRGGVRGHPFGLRRTSRRPRGHPRRRRAGRSRGRGRHLRCAARAPRQRDHLRGGRGRRKRRPLRAAVSTPSSCASASTAYCTRPSGS